MSYDQPSLLFLYRAPIAGAIAFGLALQLGLDIAVELALFAVLVAQFWLQILLRIKDRPLKTLVFVILLGIAVTLIVTGSITHLIESMSGGGGR